MVVVSCWSVDKLGERELLWKHARMAFVTVADCLVCSFPLYIPYRGSVRLPIREKIVLFFFPLSFLSRWLIRREVYIIIIRMVRGAFCCHFKLTFKHDTMKLIFKFKRVFSPFFFYEKFYHH